MACSYSQHSGRRLERRLGGDEMARAVNRLNAIKVKNAKKPGYYPDGGGLYLKVTPSGSKSWIFRYALGGRERHLGLGAITDVELATARELAAAARAKRASSVITRAMMSSSRSSS